MKKEKTVDAPLVSIIILTYRNHDYIFETLSSVFLQNYPNIELIISDDGSETFPLIEVEKYIEKERKENIKKVIINRENTNLGTVKHFNKSIMISSGEYIMALAGDDAFYDENVIQKYIDNFINSSESYLIHMAQTAMYDITLTHLQGYYCKPDVENTLYANDFNLLLEKLCLFPCLPSTSTCFKKDFFKQYGYFDESYKLIEDWPTHLRLVKANCKILYDNFIAIKHRHGGISHGGTNVLSTTQCNYYRDLLNIHQNEIKPYLSMLSTDARKRVTDRLKSEDLWIESTIYKSQHEYSKYIAFLFKHPLYIIKLFLLNNNYRFRLLARNLIFLGISLLVILPFTSSLVTPFISTSAVILVLSFMKNLSIVLVAAGVISGIIGHIGKIFVYLETFPASCLYIG